jgi:hypothetical protein
MVLGVTSALADNLLADGDGLAPLTANGVTFGNVCKDANPHPQKTVLLAIDATGHPGIGNNVYANGATVAISVQSVSGTGLSAGGGGNITMPSNWTTQSNGSQSSSVSSTVTLDPSSLPTGAYSGSVTYQASGRRASDGATLIRTANVNVSANIQNCNTAPTLNLPADITVEAEGASGAVVNYIVSASDAEDNPAPTPSCLPISGSTFPLGTNTVNCSVTDSGGLTTNGSFKIIVKDTTGPVLALANQTVEATSSAGAAVTFAPSASDLVDGSLPVTCDQSSGDTFLLGVTTVHCSATDNAGNTTSGSFTITVVDTTPPALTLPANIAGVEATGPSGAAVTYSASASDIVDGSVAVNCSRASGSTFPLGTTTVSCSATDSTGNTNTGSFTVTVQDTTPPTLTLPANITAEATGPSGADVTYSASASDTVDGSVAVNCSPASGSTFPLGTATVNCSATDSSGNTSTGSFTVTVVDTNPPTLTLPANITAEATGPSGAAVTYSASASDTVDGSVAVTCSPASGSTFPIGTTTVSCSATDAHGNTASGSFTVKVQDTTTPTLTLPANITAVATGQSGAAVTYSASASDTVDGSVSVTCNPASGSTFPIGTTTVSCSATDAHGNTANGSFTVKVIYGQDGQGIRQPINIDNSSLFSRGRAVPVKFGLLYDEPNGFNTSGWSVVAGQASCQLFDEVDAVTESVDSLQPGGAIRYDSSADQYIYNADFRKKAIGSCWRVFVNFDDGTKLGSAIFKLTK